MGITTVHGDQGKPIGGHVLPFGRSMVLMVFKGGKF
jgi:hypothetical protein